MTNMHIFIPENNDSGHILQKIKDFSLMSIEKPNQMKQVMVMCSANKKHLLNLFQTKRKAEHQKEVNTKVYEHTTSAHMLFIDR